MFSDCTSRKTCLQHIKAIILRINLANHIRYQMYHMRISLYDHQLIYRPPPLFTNPPDNIASQVCQHYMFRPLLRIRQKLILHTYIIFRTPPPPSCTGNGPCLNTCSLQPDQYLRRTSYHMQITILEIKHIWRRVDPAKSPVNIKGIRRGIKAEPLGYLNLENTPCRYIFLCLLHLPYEFLFCNIRRPFKIYLLITLFIVTMLQRSP